MAIFAQKGFHKIEGIVFYFDLHTHASCIRGEVRAIINWRIGQSQPSELSSLSVGVHPWDAHHVSFDTLQHSLTASLKPLMIGECGFDKFAKASYDVQKHLFYQHVALSESLQKPLLIHCVGYFNQLMTIKRQMKPSQPWIIHGFNKHPQLAVELAKSGFYLSFGEALFLPHSNATQVVKQLWPSPFFLETDESSYSILDIYRQVSVILDEPLEVLLRCQEAIYHRFFVESL